MKPAEISRKIFYLVKTLLNPCRSCKKTNKKKQLAKNRDRSR